MSAGIKLRRLSLSAAAMIAVALTSAFSASANPVTIYGNANPNLQATINITSLTSGSITFSVGNVLVSGVTSTITGIGFDLPGVVIAQSPGSCSGNCGNFGLSPIVSNSPGNVPQFDSVVLDWALITGPGFTGGNPPGINQGQSATFTVTGDFTGLSIDDFLAGIYIRFQSVGDPNFPNVGSDVAHTTTIATTTTTTVPEPATMLLLGAGLVGVASRLRNRRNSNQ